MSDNYSDRLTTRHYIKYCAQEMRKYSIRILLTRQMHEKIYNLMEECRISTVQNVFVFCKKLTQGSSVSIEKLIYSKPFYFWRWRSEKKIVNLVNVRLTFKHPNDALNTWIYGSVDIFIKLWMLDTFIKNTCSLCSIQ